MVEINKHNTSNCRRQRQHNKMEDFVIEILKKTLETFNQSPKILFTKSNSHRTFKSTQISDRALPEGTVVLYIRRLPGITQQGQKMLLYSPRF